MRAGERWASLGRVLCFGVAIAMVGACSPSATQGNASTATPSQPALGASSAPGTASVDRDELQVLKNVRGSVEYGKQPSADRSLATSASIALDGTFQTSTGSNSVGQITLPDSSVVTIGANTKVALSFFSHTDTTKARFYLYDGSMRFSIRHPAGAAADYTFQTATAEIAVRGTEGDVAVHGSDVQVNVYELGNPKLPVEVSLPSGRRITLTPGKSLQAHAEPHHERTEVRDLSRTAMTRFNTQFGPPRGVTPEGKPLPVPPLPARTARPRPSPHPKPTHKRTPHPKPTHKPTPHPKPTHKRTPHPKPTRKPDEL